MKKLILSTLLIGFANLHANASPANYVFSPIVEQGEKEIDFKYGSTNESTNPQATSIGFGYGVNEYWFSEIYLAKEKDSNENISIIELENKFQLTDTGKYWLDLGLVTELEIPTHNNAPYEFKIGPLFQYEQNKIQINSNIIFKHVFSFKDTPQSTLLEYQNQVKYRQSKQFEFGLQNFGELGQWNSWDSASQQKHSLGPAIFGKIQVDNNTAIKYNTAILFGLNNNTANTFRLQLEYEF